MTPDFVQDFVLPRRYDFDETLRFHRKGRFDATCLREPGRLARAARTPEGPATLDVRRAGGTAVARAWGPGAAWLLARVPALLGLHDDPAAFDPPEPIARLARRYPGVHLSRSPWMLDALWYAILQQRVRFVDAIRGFSRLTALAGEAAPGPFGLRLPPAAESVLRLPSDEFRRLEIDGRRARALQQAARAARLLDRVVDADHAALRAALSKIRGCGAWTVELTLGMSLGDPDAVPVGDLHLPREVVYALAGETDGSDARMIELLEPCRGHRFRVIRLILAASIDGPVRRWRR